MHSYLAKLRQLFSSQRDDREFSEEIETHIQLLASRFERQGMSPENASIAARRQFGNAPLHHQHRRDLRSFLVLATLARDLRFASRQLYRNPLITFIAIASLGLGIGANTAIFSIAKRVLFDTLPVHNPKELRVLTWITSPSSNPASTHQQPVPPVWGDIFSTPAGGFSSNTFSYPVYQALLKHSTAFRSLIAFKDISITATIDGTPQLVSAELLSGNAFESLGLNPTIGRSITPADDAAPGAGPVAVIADSFWSQQFARSPSAIGKIIAINGIPFTIVGVAPAPFAGLDTATPTRIFLPITMQPLVVPRAQHGTVSLLDNPQSWWVQIIARLRPELPEHQTQAQLDVVLRQAALSASTYPGGMDTFHLRLDPGTRGQDNLRGVLAQPSWILLALSGLVLLLACVNLANLLLARAASRRREISTRLAIGATRGHILRQMLTESLLLSSLGGLAGLALGYLGRNAIPGMIADPVLAAAMHASFDWQVLAFTAAVSLATGILFGLVPAWQATRTNLTSSIKISGDSTQTTPTGSRLNVGKGLVVLQIALSAILQLGAALFVRTLINLSSKPLGFRADHLLLFRLNTSNARYTDPQMIALYRQLEEKLAAIPGVSSVSFSTIAVIGDGHSGSTFRRTGSSTQPVRVQANTVGSAFFTTMGIPILQGRSFNTTDTPTSPAVAVINRALANQFFPDQNPIGQLFDADMDEATTPVQIIGIVGDTRYADLRSDTPPTFYLSHNQHLGAGRIVVEIRTQADPAAILPQVRATVASLDRNLPLLDVRTMTQQIASTLSNERIFAQLTAGFGILALILACIGIYGIMAYNVSRRTSEIGIRMALGAQANQVLALVLREVSWMALAGVTLGIAAALWLARFIAAMLYGLQSWDPLTLAGVAALLILISLLAGFGPARRASRINPTQALRHD